MKRLAVILSVIVGFTFSSVDSLSATSFQRGDADSNGSTNISDVVNVLQYLFQGQGEPACLDAADVDDSGDVVLSDPIYLLNYLFLAGAALPAPFGTCGEDPTADNLSCLVQSDECGQGLSGFTYAGVNTAGHKEYDHEQTGIRFVLIPEGQFDMGSPSEETGRRENEGPVHRVSLSPYLIAKYEITQAQYEAVMGFNPAFFQFDWLEDGAGSADLPVDRVSWDQLHAADGFLARTGLELPTEAQWEFAARGGQSGTIYHFGDDVSRLGEFSWHDANSGGTTHRVGQKTANQFGLHDMHGNAWEWTKDGYSETFYANPAATGLDPVLNLENLGLQERVVTCRGGSVRSDAHSCRSATRDHLMPTDYEVWGLGFRPALKLSQEQ